MTLFAVADFCLIPMGTPTTSVGIYIAECQRVLEKMKDEGIKYEVRFHLDDALLMCSIAYFLQMHGYGTNLEGPFPVVSKAIEACHEAVHAMGVSNKPVSKCTSY
jgi:uncharacterized protein YqgV (UPF0045/DUF77 family)